MQAGGRRFDPVWLHQPGSFVRPQFDVFRVRLGPHGPGGRVLSDIVKRGSIRMSVATQVVAGHIQALLDRGALGSISKQAGLSVSACQGSGLRRRVSGSILPDD